MLGPSGPRRLRLAIEHLAQFEAAHLFLRGPGSSLGCEAAEEGRR